MYNSKRKSSVITTLFIAFIMLWISAFTLLGTKDVKAATVDYDTTPGVSGASIRLQTDKYNDAIKFIFEIPQDSLTEYVDGGTATMYFIPTTLLDGQALTKDTADAGKWQFDTADKWITSGQNYRFIANQELPKNAFSLDITAVMCFEKQGLEPLYSTEMVKSMSGVARTALETDPSVKEDEDLEADVTSCLLYYDSKTDTEGDMYTVNYVNVDGSGNVHTETKAYLYGDTIKADNASLANYGWMDDTTLKTDLEGLKAKKVQGFIPSGELNFTVVENLGEIVTDGQTAYNPNNLQFTKLVSSTNDTVYYEEDALKNIPTNDTNAKISDTALVTNSTTTTGFVTVSAIKKIIDDASDLTSLYLTSAQIPAEYGSATSDVARDNILRSVAVKGYYLVVNDIAYTPSVKIEPYYDANSGKTTIFQGVFDGNGKTIEYDLLNSKVGLFGEIYGGAEQGAVIKNAKFLVKEVDVNVSRYMLASRIWASDNSYVHPIIENVYVGYDKAFTPVGTNIRVGISGTSHFVTYTNVIVDLSKVQGIKDWIENDNGTTFTYNYGVFDRSYTDMADGDFINTIVISEVKNVKHAAVKDYGTGVTTYVNGYAVNDNLQVEDEYVYASGLSRFGDYMALKQYFDSNTELLGNFDFMDTSMGFPFIGDKQALVESETFAKDGQTAVETITFTAGQSGEKTIDLSFLGDSYTPTIESSNPDVISVSGNQVIYSGGFATGITLTVSANIKGVSYEKTLNVEITVQNELGTIYIDADGVYTDDLSGEYTALNVIATDNTQLISGGAKESGISNDTNQLVTYSNAYVLDGDEIKGIANVLVVKKIIDEASDLTSVYLSSAPAELASANYNTAAGVMRKYAIRGYYLVIKDIEYDVTVKIAPFADTGLDAYSVFQGVFDGNGKTIAYDLSTTTVGLFGEFCGSDEEGVTPIVKNAKFIVKAVSASSYKVMFARRVWAESGWKNMPLIQNVYFGYDIENFKPSNNNLQVGVCQVGSEHAIYKNVIVDMSKVLGVKDALANDASADSTLNRIYGVFDSSGTFKNELAGGTFTNTIVISDVEYIKYRTDNGVLSMAVYASNEQVEEGDNVYANVNRYNDYAELKEYLDANPTISSEFANIIDAIEFPSVAE